MSQTARIALIVLVALAAGLAGLWARHGTLAPGQTDVAKLKGAGARILALSLPDVAGTPQALEQWRGKVMVVNFWATWCPPCLTEIPGFAQVSRKFSDRGVQFVGISIDTLEQVRKFQADKAVPYPLLIGSPQTLQVAAELGNPSQALPFTLILDPQGEIRHVKLGTLTEAELEARIQALLPP